MDLRETAIICFDEDNDVARETSANTSQCRSCAGVTRRNLQAGLVRGGTLVLIEPDL